MVIFRLLIRLTLFPLLCLSTALLIIRAQPYHDGGVRTLLMQDGCSSPCFIGIQPGITPPQQAIAALRANAWVARVGVSEALQTVAWYWRRERPAWLNQDEIPAFFYERGAVSSIRLYTTLPLGDLLLTYGGRGEQRVSMRRTVPYSRYTLDLYAIGDGFVLNALVDCHNFWNQPTHLILGARPSFIETQGYQTDSLNKAKHTLASYCRMNPQ